MKKNITRAAAGFVLLLLLYVGGVLSYGTLHDWVPEKEAPLKNTGAEAIPVIEDSLLSFVTWNLGFGGLGEESEFFFDHGNMYFSLGRMVRAPKEAIEKNNEGVAQFANTTAADFFLFQEVDFHSKRSYFANQHEMVTAKQPSYSAYFATNYRSPLVPIPVFEPWHLYGEVESGLGTYSKYQPYESVRLQLPGAFPWPVRLFQLDRCVALHRFRVKGGKELVVMNVHNSAYDADGSMKRQQMEFLKALLLQEYDAGHYVVVGGDWNQVPAFFPV